MDASKALASYMLRHVRETIEANLASLSHASSFFDSIPELQSSPRHMRSILLAVRGFYLLLIALVASPIYSRCYTVHAVACRRTILGFPT